MARTILYLAWAPFFSGAERALLLTVTHLDERRYQPHVIVGTEGELVAELRRAGLPCTVLPLRQLDRRHLPAWMASVARVAHHARKSGAALIHANDMPSFQPGGYAGRLLGLPAITHLRFPDSAQGYEWFLRPGFRRAVFVSDALRRDAEQTAPGLFRDRSDVLHDGVRLPALVDDEARRALRAELNLPRDAAIAALTGQVAEVKGIWEFIDAASRLQQRSERLHFAVLGDDLKQQGAVRRAAEEKVRSLGLQGRFHFLGFRPDAPRLIPAFDCIAVPSHIEPLGNATLEAMAAGLPVVGSRVGGIPEMVVDGETGRLVPPRDAEALADALASVLLASAERDRLGAGGRRRAESHFSLQAHADRLHGIYDRVLGEG